MKSKKELLKGLEYLHREELSYSHDNVVNVMDEYAQECCIELIQFMYASAAETIPNTRPAMWNIDIDTQVTFEELYNKFIQSKTQ